MGDGLRKSGLAREELFITTKYHSGSIQEAIRSSLRKVRAFNASLIHSWISDRSAWSPICRFVPHPYPRPNQRWCWRCLAGVWKNKRRWVGEVHTYWTSAGSNGPWCQVFRSIGVSNFDVEQLQTIMKIAKIKPAVNQILLNPYNYTSNKLLLEYASQQGIVIQAYSSLVFVTLPF